MDTTLLQPYQFLGAIYAGFIIGIVFSILRLFIPVKNPGSLSARVISALIDALFYVASTAIAAWSLLTFADGSLKLFMLITMALASLLCIKTMGRLIYSLRQIPLHKNK